MFGDINIVIIIELSNSLAFFITLFEYLRNLSYKSSTFSQEHNVSLNGGSDIVAYYASFNYLDQGGLLKAGDDGLQRYNVTAKINANLTPWLKFNYSTRFTRNDVWRPTSFNSSFYDQLGRATWPNMPVKDPNGYYTNNGWTNPVQNLVEGGNVMHKQTVFINKRL